MSRGPGRIERVIEETLRNTDRSYTVEELARFAYPAVATIEKKHRVSILRAITNVQEKIPLWFFDTYTPPWRLIITNQNNVRSYAHGFLRYSWWNAERTLEQIELMLSDAEIQSVMEPGGFWWATVESNKAESLLKTAGLIRNKLDLELALTLRNGLDAADLSPEARDLFNQSAALHSYVYGLRGHSWLHVLLGRFEPPGTPVFEYAMKHQTAWAETVCA